MQISSNIVNGPKKSSDFGGNLGYRLRPGTISPLFAVVLSVAVELN